jgi:ABC-type polysaccharide/polyol phosphate transport system ATPase subunit
LRDGTIHAAEVWKRFRIDQRPTYLQDQLGRVRDRLRNRASMRWRWALRDVEVLAEPGDSLALVGANGAGKSTLLKILTRVMYPTAGSIRVAGRVGALIEVRAGISPQLTGRENIMLTGSLMGLSRKDVIRRFDEIVAFAELEQAIDRQVKFYSTGMQMRLGFGVAAFLEPDVLLVDEVLAVGDAAFQQRCLERIQYVLSQGTTLVFVSHDLAAVEATCTNGAWLQNGEIRSLGPVREVLGHYRASVEVDAESRPRIEGLVKVLRTEAGSPEGGVVQTDGPLDIELVLESDHSYRTWIYVGVTEGAATPIFLVNPGQETLIEPGETHVRCSIASLPLPRGRYYVWAGVYRGFENGEELVPWQPIARFDAYGPEVDSAPRAIVRLAPVHVGSSWAVERP